MSQELLKPNGVRRQRTWVSNLSCRTQVIVLVACLSVVGGIAGCGKGEKPPTTNEPVATSDNKDRVAATGSDDISEESLRGLHNYMSGKDFEAVVSKLGKPALTGRQMPAARYSCKYMAAWKKKNGRYLLLHWLESTDTRNGKRIENFRIWDNQTLQQVEDLKLLLK